MAPYAAEVCTSAAPPCLACPMSLPRPMAPWPHAPPKFVRSSERDAALCLVVALQLAATRLVHVFAPSLERPQEACQALNCGESPRMRAACCAAEPCVPRDFAAPHVHMHRRYLQELVSKSCLVLRSRQRRGLFMLSPPTLNKMKRLLRIFTFVIYMSCAIDCASGRQVIVDDRPSARGRVL